jgi:hypothetical protein
MTIPPYLVGWHLSISYITPEVPSSLALTSLGAVSSEILDATDKIKKHFSKTDMNSPGKTEIYNDHDYLYTIGLDKDGLPLQIKRKSETIRHEYSNGQRSIYLYQSITVGSILFKSDADRRMLGHVHNSVSENHAKIKVHRIGPDPEEDDFEADIENGAYTLENIPFGAYTPKVTTACECTFENSQIFVFDSESTIGEITFSDNSDKANITIILKDSAGNPQKEKTVKLEQAECLDQGVGGSSLIMTESELTDSNGIALFENMLIGDYKVMVDDKYIKTIHFCSNDSKEVVIDPLWRLSIKFVQPEITTGSVIYKNFTIDCDDPINYDANYGGAECTWIDSEHIDVRTGKDVDVLYSGDLAEPELIPLIIYSRGIDFSAKSTSEIGAMAFNQVGSLIWEGTYAHGPMEHCFGNFESDTLANIKEGKKSVWSSSTKGDGFAYCDFVLEPCKNEACED